jgi:hypothetical protein
MFHVTLRAIQFRLEVEANNTSPHRGLDTEKVRFALFLREAFEQLGKPNLIRARIFALPRECQLANSNTEGGARRYPAPYPENALRKILEG